MAKDSKALPKLMTPRGTFVFPKLSEPDYGTKEYPKPDGEYSLKFRMTQADADEFLAQKFKDGDRMVSLQDLYDEAIQDGERQFAELKVETRKKLKELTADELYTVLYDKVTEEPTGEVEFKFKMKASGEFKKGPKAGQKWHRQPDLFDAKGRKIGKGVNIWGGSEGKVAFSVRPYFVAGQGSAGLSRMLNAVQVIELVTNGSRSADSYGFGAEDGFGYDPEDYAEEGTAAAKADADTSTGAGADAPGENDF